MVDMSSSTYINFWLTWDFPCKSFSLNRSHMEAAIFASCKYTLLGIERFENNYAGIETSSKQIWRLSDIFGP